MEVSAQIIRFNPYIVSGFFDARTCAEIVAELRSAGSAPATVYGRGESGSVDERVRKVTRIMPSPETFALARRRLLGCMEEIGEHFGIKLKDCEEPQFLRYQVGDFFVAHQDGNTGLLRFDHETARKISVIIFFSHQCETPQPDAYCGGSLVFSGRGVKPGQELPLTGKVGALIAFPSETTHEVTPVTFGERYSMVCWYR